MDRIFVLVAVGLAISGLGVALAASPVAKAPARTVLLVDDDGGWDHHQPFLDELRASGNNIAPTVWDVARQGEPAETAVEAADLVVWVTGGRYGDLTPQNTRMLEQRIRKGRNTLVAGKYTGKALNWGFADRWLFGFEYRDTTFFPVPIVMGGGFPTGAEAATDFGPLQGAQALYCIGQRAGVDPGQAGQPAGVCNWTWGARVAWLGFDVRDIFSSFDQRAIVRQALWYVSFEATAALVELRRQSLTKARRAFLLGELEQDLLREGPAGGPTSRALSAASKRSDLLEALRAKLARQTHSWPENQERR